MSRSSGGVWVAVSVTLMLAAGCGRPTVQAARSAPVVPKFTDRTKEAGLEFVQSHGGCGLRYFVEQVAAGAAFLDANGDGALDIYFPQPKPLGGCKFNQPLRQRLYLNDGSGRFKLSTQAFGETDTDYGISAAAGDYDNDGDVDLYVACYGRNSLLRNRGNGTFEDVSRAARVDLPGFSTGAAWFDYDGDGYLDLYVARYCEWSLDTDVPCPGPDGKRDVCHPTAYPAATHALYRNDRSGSFTEVTSAAGMAGRRARGLGVAAFDFDEDGRIDVFVANDLGPNFLYRNLGGGKFEDVAMQQNVAYGLEGKPLANMGVGVGDYDGDGDSDVAVSTFSDESYTLYRNESGGFSDVSAAAGITVPTLPYLSFGAGFLDATNQGKLDLFFANGHVSPYIHLKRKGLSYRQRNQLLLNDGAGNFTDVPEALPEDAVRVHRGACFGDVNADGRIDVLVTASDDRPTLLRNDTAPGNWLLLRLTDRHGCATPVGARARLTAGGRTLTRVLVGGGSYGGESDSRLHFGLGGTNRVDELEIRWASGATQRMTGLNVNRVLKVQEPAN